MLCIVFIVFINEISHYKEFMALNKLISIVLQLTIQIKVKPSREIMRCQGFGDKVGQISWRTLGKTQIHIFLRKYI